MTLQCLNCSEPLEPDWDTCPNCLTPVDKVLKCPTCGKELKEHWKVCPSCKTPTGRGTSTPTPNKTPTPSNTITPVMDSNYSRLGGFEEAQSAQPQRIQQIELSIGDTLSERYVIKKKIGQGGFGGVYSVHDNLTDKDLAIKVLPFIDKTSIKNILLEFESRDRIKSFDHVIKAYQPQQTQYKGQDLIIYPMELAEKSIREWLEETKEDLEGRLEEGLEIFKQACKGVEAIHEAGLIHLDLKPENILLTENKKAKDLEQKWQVKISDFGLARGLGNTNLEMLQDGIGTPAYMAPEQIIAARWKDVKEPADIYALGMILYELIDGDLPYSGTPQQIREKKRDTQIPITALQSEREVAKVAMECLEREKTKRIKSVREILVTIERKRKEEEARKKEAEEKKRAEEERKRKEAEEKRRKEEEERKKQEIEMVFVEGGEYEMGKTKEIVEVESFYIGKYPVTQMQWKETMGNNPSNFKGDDLPIENVSWYEVQAFIQKLNEKTGKNYRLPAEAEWEWAATGGNKSKGYKYSGSNNLDSVGWYGKNSDDKTHPVGNKMPNELEIYDMSGNIYEWCLDSYESDGINRKLIKGGSFDLSGDCCLVNNRNHCYYPNLGTRNIGFRLAEDV